jgi:hypothetical protein
MEHSGDHAVCCLPFRRLKDAPSVQRTFEVSHAGILIWGGQGANLQPIGQLYLIRSG